MDGKDFSNLGYSQQESDPNRSQGDPPSGDSAVDDSKQQLKIVRAKAHQRYTAQKSEQTVEEPVTRTQEPNLNEEMKNMSLEEATKSSRKSANEEKCRNKLSGMGFNSRDKLAELLDPNGNGIDDLMPQLLKDDACRDVWSACHGGFDPAMGLIYKLSDTQLTTLEQFIKYASEAKPEGSKMLLLTIEDYTKNMGEDGKHRVMTTRLNKLEYDLIKKIAKEISAKKYPVAKQQAPLWKCIAGKAGINMESISHLDIPASQGSEGQSMTMTFLQVANQRCSSKTVAWLADGLLAIGRKDVFVKLASFDDFCFDKDGKHMCE